MHINEIVIRRSGEMNLALWQAEATIAQQQEKIQMLEEQVAALTKERARQKSGAEEMMENR